MVTRLALALVLGAAPTAVATRVAAQSLSPSTVTVSNFGAVTLDGTAQSTTAIMSDFSVTSLDLSGWHVTVQATQFAEVDGAGAYVASGKTLPTGSLSMPAPTVDPSSGVTITPGPYAIDGATVQILSGAGGATGTFTVTQGGPLTLTLPGSTYAHSYRSEITVAVAAGP